MATIHHLNTSISDMESEELFTKIHSIRAQRRLRPTRKQRAKSAPAKSKRAPGKRAPKPQDLFQLASRMTPEQKTALAAELLKLK